LTPLQLGLLAGVKENDKNSPQNDQSPPSTVPSQMTASPARARYFNDFGVKRRTIASNSRGRSDASQRLSLCDTAPTEAALTHRTNYNLVPATYKIQRSKRSRDLKAHQELIFGTTVRATKESRIESSARKQFF